jgi:DNA-directed RNA polymerase subunit alpha
MISLPFVPQVIFRKGNQAIIEIAGLYPGYGTTIGNSFRRILLSSLEGAAVTKLSIKEAPHEFSTISGVREDAIQIILNIKKLRFRSYSDEPQEIKLEAKGKKEIFGRDLKLPSQVKLSNPDQQIAVLTSSKAKLSLLLTVEKGIGYQPEERMKKRKLGIGEIAIDAIFTPVQKVTFEVEHMRVGERTDFDRLSLIIKTDGAISPEEAFNQAVNILMEHFLLFVQAFPMEKKEETKASSPLKTKKKQKPRTKAKIKTKDKTKSVSRPKKKKEKEGLVENLDVSNRTKEILLENRLKTVAGILTKGKKGLEELKGIGGKSMKEIERVIKKMGLEFGN